MTLRICNKCHIPKPLDDFRIIRGGKYHMRTCRDCLRDGYGVCSCGRKSYGRSLCSECTRKKPRRFRNRTHSVYAWLNQCLRSTKALSPSRKARGYRVKENNLTIEFLIELWDKQIGRCPISGFELKTISGDPCSASIDRINSELGYESKIELEDGIREIVENLK